MRFGDIINKAVIGQQTLDGDLARLRESFCLSVAEKRAAFEAALAEVEALREALPENAGSPEPSFDDVAEAVRAEIGNQREVVLAAKAIEHGFRVRHGRLELPSTPSAALSTLKCVACWLVETVGNTGFLVTAHLAAGVPQSLGISALASGTNVLACAMGGYFIGRYREWGSKAPDAEEAEFSTRRYIAHAQFGVFAAAITFLHLTMGAIRSQETLSEIEHSLAAYAASFGDPQSFLLMLAGACASCFTYFKGKNGFDDPYPEYGRHARKVDAEIAEIEAIYQDGRDQITERSETLVDEAEDAHELTLEAYRAYNDAVKRCHVAYRALSTAISEGQMHLRTEVANLITVYRSAQKGPQSPFDADEIKAMCELPVTEKPVLPDYLHPPHSAQPNESIIAARDAALNALSLIYAGAIK